MWFSWMINIGKSRKIGGFNRKIICKIRYKWTIWWEDMGHPSLDSLTFMDSDVKFKFLCLLPTKIQMQSICRPTVDATTCVPGLRHLAAYEMISPRTARAERRRETKTHCCIAGVKTKGKRHGRPWEATKIRPQSLPGSLHQGGYRGRGVHPMRTRVTCRGRDGTRVVCDQDHLFKTGPLRRVLMGYPRTKRRFQWENYHLVNRCSTPK